jgi:hypothetical protein
MFKKTLSIISFVVLSFTANAGLITDTVNDSFIDKTTGLEWMDFGINNHLTYTQVTEQLDTTFSGWSLATQDQVYSLWANAFLGLGAHNELPNRFGIGQLYVTDGSNEAGSVIYPIANIMGANLKQSVGTRYEDHMSRGLFSGTDGLSVVSLDVQIGSYDDYHSPDSATLADNYNYNSLSNYDSAMWSTMLVKSSVDVPEPSTLAIFAFGMFGLASRKFNKNNS